MFDAFSTYGKRFGDSKYPKYPLPSRSRGLGDTVEWLAKKTKIDRAVKIYSKITGKPCGCSKRRELLNRLFPFK